MTTIVVVRKNGEACIAADTLTRFGNIKESERYLIDPGKIEKVGDSFLATTGDASLGLVLRSYFKRLRTTPSLHSVEEIFEAVRKMHAVLKEEYYLNPEGHEDDPFECSQMEALLVNSSGIFGIYALRSVMEYSKFYAFGSGAHLALGALYASYDRLESAEEIARLAVEAAAEFDDGTGLPVTTHTVRLKKK